VLENSILQNIFYRNDTPQRSYVEIAMNKECFNATFDRPLQAGVMMNPGKQISS